MSDAKTCLKRVKRGGSPRWPHYAECGRPGKVEVEGTWYCGVHDPIKREARLEERDAAYDKQMAEKRRLQRLHDAAPDLLAALKALLHHEGDFKCGISDELYSMAENAIAKAEVTE